MISKRIMNYPSLILHRHLGLLSLWLSNLCMERSLWPNVMVIRNDAKWNACESRVQMNRYQWVDADDWNPYEWF